MKISTATANRILSGIAPTNEKSYDYPIQRPVLRPGVVPEGVKAPVLAMDGVYGGCYDYAAGYGGAGYVGFPGYAYLSQLSTRAEYRMFASTMGEQLTREWIVLNSTDTAGDSTKQKITELTQDLKELQLKQAIALMAEHDSYYGRAQLFLNIKGQDRETPLLLDPRTVKKQEFKPGTSIRNFFTVKPVEAMWTTPGAYNAIDPAAEDFYVPTVWWMLGQTVHASRLRTVITRPVTDMLKPAFNFGGISMSQLAEPYVDNWIRTRQSVSNLISNFSIVALKTSMDAVLQGDEDGSATHSLINRGRVFTGLRDNSGLMLLDNEREDLVMLNTPLSGLDALQAQAQEQLCSVSKTPSVILLGVAPTGFGNVAEGEIKSFYDHISGIQEKDWSEVIELVLQIVQLIRYGSIDPDITFTWQPLYQMTDKELAEIRTADAAADAQYIQEGVLDPIEVREKLARNPESGYQGIDVTKVPMADNGNESEEEGQLAETDDVP
jgi:phage-related protein (TIGR01555 family)